jgi:putative transposase
MPEMPDNPVRKPTGMPRRGSAGASPSQSPSLPADIELSPPLPDRSHPVHGVRIDTFSPTIVFLTVCTKERQPWLADDAVHRALREVWCDATAWVVGRYVLMPDHLHLFASPGTPELPLDNWVRFWKSQFTRRHGNPAHAWQTDHWDRRLRNDESYSEKWDYVGDNPVRAGLVERSDDWPYQGELNELQWH